MDELLERMRGLEIEMSFEQSMVYLKGRFSMANLKAILEKMERASNEHQ